MSFFKRVCFIATFFIVCVGTRVSLADCLDPAGLNGALVYNADKRAMQFCDGQNWIRFPGPPPNCALGTWTYIASPEAWVAWESVTYGNGLFVAVGGSGTSRVMTSPDGVTWTSRTAAQNNYWHSVAFGNGTFVAVATDGTNRVMTSPDGINWTARTAAQANQWRGVTYGAGLFVAVADSGTNRVMTSPDGITWTVRNAAATSSWGTVTYAEGTFVALSRGGCTTCAMTSQDGINWTGRTAPASGWMSVIYGGGQFVAVAYNGTQQIATSPDGIAWTGIAAPEANYWNGVVYADGHYIAVASSGTNRFMYSQDGVSWTAASVTASSWTALTYADGKVVAVGTDNVPNQIMTMTIICGSGGGCPNIGNVCTDGTIFAGMSPDGNVPMYATRCDHGMTWNGSSCTGSRSSLFWNDGNTDFAMTGISNVNTGQSNTAALVAMDSDSVAPGVQPHNAAAACHNLTQSGYGDWYLPALDELDVLQVNRTAIGNLVGSSYWSSSESLNPTWEAVDGMAQEFSTPNVQFSTAKSTDHYLRCVRKQHTGQCADPVGAEGDLVFNTTSRVLQWCDGADWVAAGPLYPGGPSGGCANPSGSMGDIVYNTDHCVIQYCDGGKWRGVARGPGYVANAVTNAAATATHLQINSTISGATDGPRYTLSTWFRMLPQASNQTTQVLFENNAGRIQLGFYSDAASDPLYDVWISGKNSSDVWHVDMYKNDYIAENVWYHLVASFDTTLGAGHVYVNDQELAYNVLDVSSGGQAMDVQTNAYFMHFYGWANGFRGDVADFWFDNVYLDLDVEANRRKFRSASGRPVNLGVDGSTPTGSQPLIFFSGDRTTWATNKGRGGAFTLTGSLQNVVLGDGKGEGSCPQ
ncbi:hypothetical protein RHIZO_03226 [Rhizobiaceae bacterium]|nr:hypothetical protein RHIZO_03226 [Rhizobiaceae bacterium]